MTDRGRLALSPAGAGCWLAAVVGYALCLLTGDGWLLAVVALCFITPLVDVAFAAMAGSAEPQFPATSVMGEVSYTLVRVPGRTSLSTDVEVRIKSCIRPTKAILDAGHDRVAASCEAGHRGRLHPLKTMADTWGPLGLAARRRHLTVATEAVVLPLRQEPKLPPLGGDEPGAVDREDERGIDPAGVRSYRAGDSQRGVHWRATARRSTPVVRVWSQPQGQGLTVVTGRLDPAQEVALARAAWTAAHAVDTGVPVTIRSGNRVVRPVTAAEALMHFALLRSETEPLQVPAGPLLWLSADPPPGPQAVMP